MTTETSLRDGLTSMTAGLGTIRDKSASVEYVDETIPAHQLRAAYRTSWLARKVVDIPALDAFREWRNWQASDADVGKLEDEEKKHQLRFKAEQAYKLARLYGTCYLYFDLGDDPSKELNPKVAANGRLRFVTLLTKEQLVPADYEDDPLAERFGRPKSYTVSGSKKGTKNIHFSRVVAFIGLQNDDPNVVDVEGLSVLNPQFQAIQQFDAVATNTASLVFEAKVDVISVNGLMTKVGNTRDEQKLLDRYRLAATAKGNNGLLLLDAETESYEQKTYAFNALADLMDSFAQNASGAADIPMTRLFGRSPAGMSATGESDLRNYYDRIGSVQELELRPQMSLLDECLIWSALGNRPADVHYLWGTLWKVSDKEKFELGKMLVEIIEKLANVGILPEDALYTSAVASLVQAGVLTGLDSAVKDSPDDPPFLDDEEEPPEDESPDGGGQKLQDSQPRAPKGAPNGGQWIKGGGSGGAAASAAAKVATSKYSADKVQALVSKDPKTLSHYEKKVLAKYKKALSEEGAAPAVSTPSPAAPKAPSAAVVSTWVAFAKETTPAEAEQALQAGGHALHPEVKSILEANVAKGKQATQAAGGDAKTKALASIATPSYPAEKVAALLDKNPKELTHYEKKKLVAYKKALAAQSADSSKPAPPKVALPKSVTPDAAVALKKAAGAPVGMQVDTVHKLASGEWKPDPSKPYQKVIAEQGAAYLKTGTLPAAPAASSTSSFGSSFSGPTLSSSLAASPPPISNKDLAQTKLAAITTPLSETEKSAARQYTGNTYLAINGALRSGSSHSLVPAIDAAIAKTATTENLTLVRGISQKGMSAWLKNGELKVGSTITDKGYASTTRVPSVASGFAGGGTGFGLKINIPKGSKLLPLKSISKYAGEDEFLLPRGSGFKVTGIDKVTGVISVDLVAA